MHRSRVPAFAAILPLVAGACTTFATVRSADVRPGPSVAVHASYSTPPGDVAGWFWSYDCVTRCSFATPGIDVGYTYGWRRPDSVRAVALGVGVNSFYPYVDGYMQLASGQRPYGVGVRVGLPVQSWRQHQLYARYDIPLRERTRLLVNPGILLHEGRTPNGQTSGHFVGLVQGVGLEFMGRNVSWTPAVAVVAGQAQRRDYFARLGPERRVFAMASLGFTVHRSRSTGTR